MEQLIPLIPILACPVVMGLCMWMMAKHMRGDEKKEVEPAAVEQPHA